MLLARCCVVLTPHAVAGLCLCVASRTVHNHRCPPPLRCQTSDVAFFDPDTSEFNDQQLSADLAVLQTLDVPDAGR